MNRADSWGLSGMTILLPWGCGTADEDDEVRCRIGRMGGAISHAKPQRRPYGECGKPAATATHEYVPDGVAATTALPTLAAAELRRRHAAAVAEFAQCMARHVRPAHVPVVTSAPGAFCCSRKH